MSIFFLNHEAHVMPDRAQEFFEISSAAKDSPTRRMLTMKAKVRSCTNIEKKPA